MDLRAPLGESPAALSALFAKPAAAAASASAPPAPSSGKATSGDLSRQSASLDLRRMSSDSGFLSVVHGNAQQGRGTAKASPRMKSFRWFMRQREDFQRSESSARLKVRTLQLNRSRAGQGPVKGRSRADQGPIKGRSRAGQGPSASPSLSCFVH
jgi:hypothetical protein